MGYASQSGRARTNPNSPSAFGCCDRCGVWRNLNDLVFQFDYRGPRLANLRIKVCKETGRCNDVPFQHWRPVITPPDPVPVRDPRLEAFTQDETEYLATNASVLLLTNDGSNLVMTDVGYDPRANFPPNQG